MGSPIRLHGPPSIDPTSSSKSILFEMLKEGTSSEGALVYLVFIYCNKYPHGLTKSYPVTTIVDLLP